VVRQFLESATWTGWVGYSVISKIEVSGYPGMAAEAELAARAVLGQYHEAQRDAAVTARTITLCKTARIKTPDAIVAASLLAYPATRVTRNVADFKGLEGSALLESFASPDDTSQPGDKKAGAVLTLGHS